MIDGSPAYADSAFGCTYPRVCLYLDSSDWIARTPTAAYQQVTPGWQYLGPRSRHAYAVYNSRLDDTAWLLGADETVACVEPNSTWFFDVWDPPHDVAAVKIVDEDECFASEGGAGCVVERRSGRGSAYHARSRDRAAAIPGRRDAACERSGMRGFP